MACSTTQTKQKTDKALEYYKNIQVIFALLKNRISSDMKHDMLKDLSSSSFFLVITYEHIVDIISRETLAV